MIAPSVSGAAGSTGLPTDPRETAMRKAAADLEGLFVQQLYKSMRETVPTEGGLVERSQGEEVFAGLMDERLAADTGTRWHRGLGDAIYRALRQKAGLGLESAVQTPVQTAIPTAVPSVTVPVVSAVPIASPARTP